jgi:hypothetical protein
MKTKKYIACISKVFFLLCLAETCLNTNAQQSSYTYDLPGNLTAVTGTNSVAPSITTQPQSALLYSNNPVSLSVVASGAGITYQWLSNGTYIGVVHNCFLKTCLPTFLEAVV